MLLPAGTTAPAWYIALQECNFLDESCGMLAYALMHEIIASTDTYCWGLSCCGCMPMLHTTIATPSLASSCMLLIDSPTTGRTNDQYNNALPAGKVYLNLLRGAVSLTPVRSTAYGLRLMICIYCSPGASGLPPSHRPSTMFVSCKEHR